MKKLLSILLIAALTVIAPAALAEEGVTRVLLGQDPSPSPIGWINEDGTVDGYDRAVINAVDELLPEYEFDVEVTDFPSLFTGIDSGRYAAIIDNLSWKQERADRYLYSNEYYLWTTTVIAFQKGRTDIASLEDLGGKSTVTPRRRRVHPAVLRELQRCEPRQPDSYHLFRSGHARDVSADR